MKSIAIVGGAGFIGRNLVDYLLENSNHNIRLLSYRNKLLKFRDLERVTVVDGDLFDKQTLIELIKPDSIVINLVYLGRRSALDNVNAVQNLVKLCVDIGIKRLIHCSTAVVVGRVREKLIDEDVQCNPASEYEKTKLEIEELLLSRSRNLFELVVLRPTAVFGPHGKNLVKLADDLSKRSSFVNYLKSCLYNNRRMNLVCVSNVVSAIAFLVDAKEEVDRQTYIISDDEYEKNNYRDLELFLKKRIGQRDYVLPRIVIPPAFLLVLLRILGKSNYDLFRHYDSNKLEKLGYKKTATFEEGLSAFTRWYKQTLPKNKL